MKKFTQVLVVTLLTWTLAMAVGSASAANAGRGESIEKAAGNVEIILQNKCTRDVKYTLKSGGTTTNGVVAKGDKVKLNLAAGTEIVVEGDVFMTVADSDAGQTFIVCR